VPTSAQQSFKPPTYATMNTCSDDNLA
jgi:hypothetical protein